METGENPAEKIPAATLVALAHKATPADHITLAKDHRAGRNEMSMTTDHFTHTGDQAEVDAPQVTQIVSLSMVTMRANTTMTGRTNVAVTAGIPVTGTTTWRAECPCWRLD